MDFFYPFAFCDSVARIWENQEIKKMAAHSSSKLIPLRRTLLQALKPRSPSSSFSTKIQNLLFLSLSNQEPPMVSSLSRLNFSCHGICNLYYSSLSKESQGPAAIDYQSVTQEDEYHKLANSTIHDLLEKLEVYGDSVEIDGYDVDYGNEVLTLKLGSLGTYVINKQTPNRQIWISSPVSGPSRFDWDQNAQAWIYRRTRENLIKVLESELEQLCREPIRLS